jgi:hypothetical protein
MSTLAPPTRKRAAWWLCLAAVAAVLLSGCGTAVGYANTFLELQEAGINGADISTSDDEVTLEYDSSAAPERLEAEMNRAAEVIWRNLPQRFTTLRVDPRLDEDLARDYSREELQSRFGPRPARLDQGTGDIEQDARNTFRNILIGAAIGFGVLLVLVILVIVLVVRAARKRRPPVPPTGWPAGPGGGPPAPWPQQPGYGPPPAQQWAGQGQPPPAAQPPPWQPGADQPTTPTPYPPPPPSAYGQQGQGGWQPPPSPPPAPPEGEAPAGSEDETRVLGGERDRSAPDQRGGPTPPA